MDLALISAVLGSSVFAALLTHVFGKLQNDKKIKIENITKERKQWRDRLRVLIIELTIAFDNKNRRKVRSIESELITSLNPEDGDDIQIINMFPELYENWEEDKLREFSDRMSYLLKHDWERTKVEASSSITVFTLLLSSVVACVSINSLFCLMEYMLQTEDLKLSISVFYFSTWLVVNLLVVAIFSYAESTVKNPCLFFPLLFNRTIRKSYQERCKRN